MGDMEQLRQLVELFESGALSEAEFVAAKRRLLGIDDEDLLGGGAEPGPLGDSTPDALRAPGEVGAAPQTGDGPSVSADPPGGPAAGWYSDPWEEHAERYWDGERWTGDVSRAESPPGSGTQGMVPPPSDEDAAGQSTGWGAKWGGWLLILGIVVASFLLTGGTDDSDPDSGQQSGRASVTVDDVTITTDEVCDLTGDVVGRNESGNPVEVFVEVGLYDGDTLVEVDSGYWDLSTGWEGRMGTLRWADEYFPDFDELECLIHEVRVRDRS